MVDEEQLHAAFEAHDDYPQLEFEGSVAELKSRLRSLVRGKRKHERKRSLVRTSLNVLSAISVIVGLAGLLLLFAFKAELMEFFAVDLAVPDVAGQCGAVVVFGCLWILADTLRAMPDAAEDKPATDLRKWGLLGPLLELLEREVAADERVSLQVDFRSATIRGQLSAHEQRFDGLGTVVPDGEPRPHVWLRLRARLGTLELHMRVRTLVGNSGDVELRLRDEIGIELRGEGLATIAAEPPSELRTSLLAHELTPTSARLQFRGRGAARRVLIEAEPASLFEDGTPPEYSYYDLEWLLNGPALADHIEAARSLVRPRG